jgi:pilus assembly protein Flp/PilA
VLTLRGNAAVFRRVTTHEIRVPGNLFNAGIIPRPMLWRFMMNSCSRQEGQAIAEYGVILALILVLVVGTVRLVGHNANNMFSSVASTVN